MACQGSASAAEVAGAHQSSLGRTVAQAVAPGPGYHWQTFSTKWLKATCVSATGAFLLTVMAL